MPKRQVRHADVSSPGSSAIQRYDDEREWRPELDPDVLLEKHRICKSKYTHFHVVIFMITFISYAMIHANRKSFSNVKTLISYEWTPSFSNSSVRPKLPNDTWNSHDFFSDPKSEACKTFLGTLDTVFMVAYAVGLYISGPLGDRFNLRYVLCSGMVLTSITVTESSTLIHA